MKININTIKLNYKVPTEETIINNLIKIKDTISDCYELCIIHYINNDVIKKINNEINSTKTSNIKVFICQHIKIHKLNFNQQDIIFTPHSSYDDPFYSIPHFSKTIDKNFINKTKKYKFSFLGSITTHIIRKQLIKLFPTCCFNSGHYWGLDKSLKDNDNFKNQYIKLLGESEFSICPRGTGISTIRLFESMAMNSIPIVIADNYKFPLNKIIPWENICVQVPENEINKIPLIIKDFKYDINELQYYYNTYLSNNNLHQTIKITLTRLI